MSERRRYLDAGIGERRGVVSLDGRPERLLIERDGDVACQALGAKSVARVRAIEKGPGLAFLELAEGPDAVLNLTPEAGKLAAGAVIEIEIRAEARAGKGASARFVSAAEGPPRLVAAAPLLEDRLQAFAREATIQTGAIARSMADGAQDEALETIFPLPGGGSLAVEPTRALTAVDVDLGARAGEEAKRAARAANFAALNAAARILRLKGLGGLVVIDLVGRGHDGPAMLSAARVAFAPDNPGVALGPVSRFGTLEITVPRRARPTLDILRGEEDAVSALTHALALIRALEREAIADSGGRFEAVAAPATAEYAAPLLARLTERLGARLTLREDPGLALGAYQVARL